MMRCQQVSQWLPMNRRLGVGAGQWGQAGEGLVVLVIFTEEGLGKRSRIRAFPAVVRVSEAFLLAEVRPKHASLGEGGQLWCGPQLWS